MSIDLSSRLVEDCRLDFKRAAPLADHRKKRPNTLTKELLTFLWLLLAGVLLLPIAVFLVGSEIFGPYAGSGFGDFYRDMHSALRDGEPVVIFLLFSPYLVWQLVRGTFRFFFRLAPGKRQESSDPAS